MGMFTVAIMVNGQPLFARSAVDLGPVTAISVNPRAPGQELHKFKLDTGAIIEHRPIEGGIALIKKMIETIQEV